MCISDRAAAAFFPVIIGYSCYFYSRIGKRFQDADEAEGALSSTVQENLTGVRVVRAFGREKYEIDRFDEKNTAYSNSVSYTHLNERWERTGKEMEALGARLVYLPYTKDTSSTMLREKLKEY